MLFNLFYLSGSISGDSAQEVEVYNPFVGNSVNINGASCNFIHSSLTNGGSIQIRTATGGGGSGITIALDSTNDRGTTTSDLVIPSGNNSVFIIFTNCDNLGVGAINIELEPVAVALTGINDNLLSAMLSLRLGKEITATELNFFIKNAKMEIMHSGDYEGMETSSTLSITANTESYLLTSIHSTFKNPISLYIKDSAGFPKYHIVRAWDRDTFNRQRVNTIDSTLPIPNGGYPLLYNIQGGYISFAPCGQSATVTVEHTYYLPDISGSSTDYFYTHFPKAMEYLVLADAELMDKNGDVNKATMLKKLGLGELRTSKNHDIQKKHSGGGFAGMKRG